ncbi:MAG: transglycosylase domain-containing protein, partial [Methylobacterium organophilum]|nr:transglycosylase domain-containing protein [Methylobacterium organophilum]
MYFDKSAEDLDWPESALLASLIRGPVSYDPIRNPQLADQRRRLALERLVEVGAISETAMRDYAAAPLPV